MRIAETARHHPIQDHELSISRHIPQREYPKAGDLTVREKGENAQRREEGGISDPITPIVGTAGGKGQTPIPVAESTPQPGEEAFTPAEVPTRERLEQRGMSSEPPTPPPPPSEDGARGKFKVTSGEVDLNGLFPGSQNCMNHQEEGLWEKHYHPGLIVLKRGNPRNKGPYPQRASSRSQQKLTKETSGTGQRSYCEIEGRTTEISTRMVRGVFHACLLSQDAWIGTWHIESRIYS